MNGPVDVSELLTPAEVAERLKIDRHTVYVWLKSGQLEGQHVGRVWRVSVDQLLAFLQRGQPWRG